jgi:hypothetical protein
LYGDHIIKRYPSQAIYILKATVRTKAISLQAWTGPEVSRKMRLPDFKTAGT